MIAAKLPAEQHERLVAAVRKRLVWGDPNFELLLAHTRAVEIENAALRERIKIAEATPFSDESNEAA